MKIYREMFLKEFKFWGEAENFTRYITDDEFDLIEDVLNELDSGDKYFDKTWVNDLFTFDRDFIANILGYNDEEEMIEDRDK